MRNKRLLICASLILASVINNSVWAYWDVIDLGTLDGYTKSTATSINDSGQIVGYAYNDYYNSKACLFDSTGSQNNINLGTLPNGQYSKAYSINNNGQIVGYGDPYACIFDPTGGGTNINLGRLPNGSYSCAYSINNNGQIVGCAEGLFPTWDPEKGPVYSYFDDMCLFDSTGGGANTNLGKEGEAYCINDNGQIVGIGGTSPYFYNAHAYLFEPTGYTGLYDSISLGQGTALSINNNGQIVGCKREILDVGPDLYHAYRFDPNGGYSPDNLDLGTLGGDYSEARSINDNGQIVGWAGNDYGDSHACLFDPTGNGANIDLNSFIDPSSGWILKYAYDINNNGWIVGQGINPDGDTRAFLLVPEPVSVVMFGLGTVILSRWRKRQYKDLRK